ncbi:MAG: DNA recombination protein RmuC [Alphaproteobacteria bacterium]|nr:DNA recombination protein RmuC [Alphaproteobacteria bacterium]
MDPILVFALLTVLAVGGFAVLLVQRRGGIARLEGRLDQIAKSEAEAQSQLSQRLQAQERAIGERLEQVSRRLNDGLTQSSDKTVKTMAELQERLAVIDAAQKNIAELSGQVVGLQDILANKQARGAFGEVQLQDIVQGVLPPSAYRFQVTLSNNKRADCVIELPKPPGPIAIDAKIPLESYRALLKAETDAEKKQADREFRVAIRKHVTDIADRYIVQGETADSALMFLPSETVYAELHTNYHDVVDRANRARVWIVSPTTLWATLTTIRAILKDVHMREQAHIIQKEVVSLLDDVQRLDQRVRNLQTHFHQAEGDIREIQISTRKVTGRAERIGELENEEDATEKVTPVEPVKPRLVE